jgi:hypothetical protein
MGWEDQSRRVLAAAENIGRIISTADGMGASAYKDNGCTVVVKDDKGTIAWKETNCS